MKTLSKKYAAEALSQFKMAKLFKEENDSTGYEYWSTKAKFSLRSMKLAASVGL